MRVEKRAVIERKVQAQERLSFAEGVALFECGDLLWLGRLADSVRQRLHGDAVYFVRNRHINHTNICKNRCVFCAFSRGEGEAGAYTLSLDQIVAKARASLAEGVTEFHIVGGEHPALSFVEVEEMIARLHALAPGVTLTAFTASEIAHFAATSGLSVEQVLRRLKSVGLGSLPGGGAEVFASRVRDLVCPRKISANEWLHVHMTAHRCALPTNATMLYGHVETVEERVDHLVRLREAQDETGGFQAFIPLSFHPVHTGLSHLPGPSGVEDLTVLAVSRLMLDNFAHIKAYWIMLGLKLAQIGLFFGADDLDGTVVEEVITRMAGGVSDGDLTVEELVHQVRTAGRVPVERDTFYGVVKTYD